MSDQDTTRPGPRVVAREDHTVSRREISPNALKVLYRLQKAGFHAYLVGGAVRDLMLGRRPKDFDIGTDARPSQVRQLFRNARIIGRRFRLVMITFAGETVEVATFRRSSEPPDMENGETTDVLAPAVEADEYGTPEEDAWRRDFTVNGLFYNVADFAVIDHVGGLEDLAAGLVRSIGPARQRFGEDPVRMMRAVEYAARLGFALEEDTAQALGSMQAEIRRAAPARIAYEISESLRSGSAAPIFEGFERVGLLEHLVPEAHEALAGQQEPRLWRLLEAADRARAAGRALSDEALFGLLFLPTFLDYLEGLGESRVEPGPLEERVREILTPPGLRMVFSHYRSHVLRFAYLLLARLLAPPRSAKAILRTARHETFGVASELATLVAEVDERHRAAVERWFAAVSRVQSGLPLDEKQPGAAPERRRRRPRRRRRGPARPQGGSA
jgi:poly(A) polymerase